MIGLFSDPRVTIHAEDGRHCLARAPATYDMIIADLFTPWRARAVRRGQVSEGPAAFPTSLGPLTTTGMMYSLI